MADHPLETWSLSRGAAATTITSFPSTLLITTLHTQNLRPGQCFSLQHSVLASLSFTCNLKVGCCTHLRYSSVSLSSCSLRPDHSQRRAHRKGSRLSGTSGSLEAGALRDRHAPLSSPRTPAAWRGPGGLRQPQPPPRSPRASSRSLIRLPENILPTLEGL